MTSDLERGCEDAGPGGGTRGASNKAFGLFFCWTGTFVVAGIFTGVNGGNTAPPFSDAVIFAIVRVAAAAAARLWVGAVMAVLLNIDVSVSGNPIAGVRRDLRTSRSGRVAPHLPQLPFPHQRARSFSRSLSCQHDEEGLFLDDFEVVICESLKKPSDGKKMGRR